MKFEEIAAISDKYMMKLFSRSPVCFERGEGSRVYGVDGRRYLDFLGGIAVNALGHSHPAIVKAIKDQAEKLIHCTNLYYIESQALAAKKLAEISCADRAFFCNSGAEANEAAIKLARTYHYKRGEANRTRIVTLMDAFHGRTLATVAAAGQFKYHKPFLPMPPWFDYVRLNDADAMIAAVSRENTAAVMIEAVQGESGVHIADAAFVRAAADACEKTGALLIFDEVQTGLGRTGKMFAYEHYGVEPDIISLAKALGGGFPVGAMIAKESVAEAFGPGDHGSTFGGNPLACAAVNAALNEIADGRLYDAAAKSGAYLMKSLRDLPTDSGRFATREIRGLGLMIAIEFAEPVAAEARDRATEAGLLIGACGSNTARLLPPLNISAAEIDEAVGALSSALWNGSK